MCLLASFYVIPSAGQILSTIPAKKKGKDRANYLVRLHLSLIEALKRAKGLLQEQLFESGYIVMST